MAEPLTTNLALRDLDAALVADDAAVLHPFVFAAETLPIRDRTKNTSTKQPVALRFEGAIVDRFGLCDLAVRP